MASVKRGKASVKRGKALVASLRAQAGVRDPEALAAYLGRFKKARKAGKSVAAAKHAASGGDTPKAAAADRSANLKKGDKVFVKGADGEHTVLGKTRDGKIKVLPKSGRDRVVDASDVSPLTRDGKTLNDRGSFGGQNPDDPGYRGKNAPPMKKSSQDLVKARRSAAGDRNEPPSIGQVQRTVLAEANRLGWSAERKREVMARRMKELEKIRKAYLARQRRKKK